MKKLTHATIWVGALVIIALTGCSTSPIARLYVIEPIVDAGPVGNYKELAIAIGPITLPEYLNRKEILTHDQRYRVSTAEFDRWAEPLEDNIASTLAENLSLLVPSDQVAAYPWDHSAQMDYSVRVRVHRFGSEPGGEIVLNATWSIVDVNDLLVAHKKGRYTESRNGTDVLAVVGAMSQVLEQMSRDIANALTPAGVSTQQSNVAERP